MLINYIKQSSSTSVKESQAIRFLICDDPDDWVYIEREREKGGRDRESADRPRRT
jgi:hypothetical protein